MEPSWGQLLVLTLPGVAASAIAVLGPYLAAKLKASQERDASNAEIGQMLRDELRAELADARNRLSECLEANEILQRRLKGSDDTAQPESD